MLGTLAARFWECAILFESQSLLEIPDFAESSSAARTLDMARCTHETPVPATECMLSMVGQHNEEHFFIASQDVELRKRLRTVPGAALLFLSTAGLILEPPSETQQNFARLVS
jgi:U3 small nucleolar RNA-associated protein 23